MKMRLHWGGFSAFPASEWAFGVRLHTTTEQLISPSIVNASGRTEQMKHFLLVQQFFK